jgi:hypothetical protein
VARVGSIGGPALNSFFDQFGLESVILLVVTLTLLLQITRYFYWAAYGAYGKPWSPFIFVCVAIAVELLYDAAMKYGIMAVVPTGKNDLLDGLRRYMMSADARLFAGHAVWMAVTALVAMILYDMDDLYRYVFMGLVLYGGMFALSGVPAAAGLSGAAPGPKQKPMKE